jgi:predicted ATPase
MIAAVAGGKPLPEEVLAQIWAKTEGVPLFVEELTKTVLESGLLEDIGDRYALSGPLPPLAIPSTLQDSLMARLDRLAPVKEVAQTGAVIGREFSYRLLAALAPLEESALQDALSHLVGAELVFRRGTIPDATYSFKHAFVQDAAYASLLKARRQQLHAELAQVLRERFPELAESQPEILAHHLTEAGLADEAIAHWQQAGQLAAERSAYAEAAAHIGKGLELLATLPESAHRAEQELDLLTAFGSIAISTKGHGSPEVARVYTRARELARSLGDTPHLAAVLQGLRMHYGLRAELQPAREAAAELLALGERIQDRGYLLEGHRALGVVSFFAGDFLAAREHLSMGVDLYDAEAHRDHVLRYENDPCQTCLGYGAKVLWALGYPDQAVEMADRALVVAQATNHVSSVAESTCWHAEIMFHCREVEATRDLAASALALATEHGLPLWIGMAAALHGWALTIQGNSADGIAQMREGLVTMSSAGDRLFGPYHVATLAEALRTAGQAAAALGDLDAVIDAYRQSEVAFWASRFRWLRGELLLADSRPDIEATEACFRQAIAIAQAQSAKSLELRAATSLARLWAHHGRRAEARDLLAQIYCWFTEGFDTADLKDAKALLDELA